VLSSSTTSSTSCGLLFSKTLQRDFASLCNCCFFWSEFKLSTSLSSSVKQGADATDVLLDLGEFLIEEALLMSRLIEICRQKPRRGDSVVFSS